MHPEATPLVLHGVSRQPAPAWTEQYIRDWFEVHHRIASPIRRYLTANTQQCDALVDIGTGDATVLDDLASRFPQFRSLFGIAADSRALASARTRCSADQRIALVKADPWSWLRRNERRGLMVFSYDNLSVLAESTLQQWFAELPDLGVVALTLIEPRTGGCADLPAMLERNGWQVRHRETPALGTQSWCHVFASRQPTPTLLGEFS